MRNSHPIPFAIPQALARGAGTTRAGRMKGEARMITTTYHSPLGDIVLVADARGLRGLWFDGDSRSASEVPSGAAFLDMHRPVGQRGGGWPRRGLGRWPRERRRPAQHGRGGRARADVGVAQRVFAGRPPLWIPPLHLDGSELDHAVSVALLEIPFGARAAVDAVVGRVAALSPLANPDREGGWALRQMVERSIARNPEAIIVPAHRADADVEHMAGHALSPARIRIRCRRAFGGVTAPARLLYLL